MQAREVAGRGVSDAVALNAGRGCEAKCDCDECLLDLWRGGASMKAVALRKCLRHASTGKSPCAECVDYVERIIRWGHGHGREIPNGGAP